MLNRIRRTRISSESTIQPDTTSHRDRFGLSFRTKIQLYFVASILALAAVTTVVAVWTGRSEIRRAIENDFARAPAQISGQLQSTFESFQQDVETSAGDPLYKAWLGRASAADALDGRVSASDLKAAHDGLPPTAPARWSEFRVTNDAGIVLVDARQQDAFGEDLSRDPLVARALSGVPAMRVRGNLLEMAGPVLVEGTVRGLLLAGTRIDPVSETAGKILHGTVTLSDKPAGREGVLRTEVRNGATMLITTVAIPGALPGEKVAWATLTRSLTDDAAPQQAVFIRAIVLATILGLAASMLLSVRLSHSLAAPVAELTQATRQVGAGNYDYQVAITGHDELGQLGASFNQMAAGLKQRVFFESALRRYLAAQVVDQLVADPSRLRLGGERREVTILFFDVAGFTTLSEKISAEELVTLVNGYLDALLEAVFRHNGTFDKFIGDAVMAFWGAPLTQEDHAALACRAAIDMHRAFRRFTSSHPSPLVQALRARIGINTGVAALGNLGSSKVMSYTAMGDAVNLASRMEGLNKVYGTSVLAAETTLQPRDSASIASREVDTVAVVGRSTGVRIFELLDAGSAPPPAALASYAEGLAWYRAGGFAEAEAAFRSARAKGDGPCAEVMAARAARFAATPPGGAWDGVYKAEVK